MIRIANIGSDAPLPNCPDSVAYRPSISSWPGKRSFRANCRDWLCLGLFFSSLGHGRSVLILFINNVYVYLSIYKLALFFQLYLFRISGTTPGNRHPETTPELSIFVLQVSRGLYPFWGKLASFFHFPLFRVSSLVLRISGRSPAIGFVFSNCVNRRDRGDRRGAHGRMAGPGHNARSSAFLIPAARCSDTLISYSILAPEFCILPLIIHISKSYTY